MPSLLFVCVRQESYFIFPNYLLICCWWWLFMGGHILKKGGFISFWTVLPLETVTRLSASHKVTQSHFASSTLLALRLLCVDYDGSAHLFLHKLRSVPAKCTWRVCEGCCTCNLPYHPKMTTQFPNIPVRFIADVFIFGYIYNLWVHKCGWPRGLSDHPQYPLCASAV